jgi:hypothetical protein
MTSASLRKAVIRKIKHHERYQTDALGADDVLHLALSMTDAMEAARGRPGTKRRRADEELIENHGLRLVKAVKVILAGRRPSES